jgi:hypothetical protein
MTLHRTAWLVLATLVFLAGCLDKPAPTPSAPATADTAPAPTTTSKPVSPTSARAKPDPAPTEKSKPDPSKAKPDFSLDATEWFDEWEKDKAAAGEKYKDKIIELSGEVESLRLLKRGEKDPGPCLFLKAGPKPTTRVMVLTQEKEPWARVSPGSKVKVKGTADGSGVNLMIPFIVAPMGPNPAVATSSVSLGRDFAGNKDFAEEKYLDKTVILAGEIAQLEIIDKHRFALKLKNDSGVDIVCDFAPVIGDSTDAGILLGQVKNGQRVTVVGQCSMLDDVKLKNCLPIIGMK